jgi:predicted RNA-binding Zn-ribbon protein involved in translation (DUF1610 family)
VKKEVTVYVCDRCGFEYNAPQSGWYVVLSDGENAFIGVKAMFSFSNCAVGLKYEDLCPKCTLEIARRFVERMENE